MASSGGKGERTLLHDLDYPCTARLRHHRLLAYLRGYSYNEMYDAAKEKMGVIFHVRDLVKLVKAAQLREAYYYVRSFAPMNQSSNEAALLSLFLQDLMAINCFAHGQPTEATILCDWFIRIYRHPVLAKHPCFAAIVDDVLFLLSDRVRDFLDWQLVRNEAAKMVEEMAGNAPELRDMMRYPRGRNSLYHVVSIGFSVRRRRHMKKVGRKRSTTDLARFYLQSQKRLPSSGQGSATTQGETLIALLERALEAGRRPVLKQNLPAVFPLEALLTRGAMVAHAPKLQAALKLKIHPSKGAGVDFLVAECF